MWLLYFFKSIMRPIYLSDPIILKGGPTLTLNKVSQHTSRVAEVQGSDLLICCIIRQEYNWFIINL